MATSQGLVRSVGYVDSDGERIYYESTGEGDPVVLCHGLGGNHAIWWRQVEAFAAERRLITWDQRGFGNSTVVNGDVRPAAARRDLGALLDHLGLESVDLVGQSMGGWTVLGYALDHPERVRSLTLSTTLAGAEKKFVDVLVNAEPDQDRFNRREHPVLSAEFCAAHPDLGVLYNQISSFGAKPSPVEVLRGMAEDRFDDGAVAALAVPTLVVMAGEDLHCPPHAMQPVVDGMPDGRLVEVPGGHSAYYEDPDTWNAAVLGFLRQRA
ncbi:MAG: alpha/beta hydrolase [Actinomycetia bacterium]|nr:alpha/beta hydrolase [Actinomycetes bacterium]